jgi:hypothetical protein
VNNAEGRANICKDVDRKPVFSAVYGMYTVTLKELKGVLKISAQAGHIEAVNKASVESTGQDDDFRELKRRKWYSCNDSSQTAKKLITSVPTSTDVKLPPKQC